MVWISNVFLQRPKFLSSQDRNNDIGISLPHRKQILCHIFPAAGIDSAWKAGWPQRGHRGVSEFLNDILNYQKRDIYLPKNHSYLYFTSSKKKWEPYAKKCLISSLGICVSLFGKKKKSY